MLNMSEAYKQGKDAYYRGMERNRNPHIGKGGVLSQLHLYAWYKGFDYAATEARGT